MAERKALADLGNVDIIHDGGFSQRTLALPVFDLGQVPLALLAADELARARHLEAFGDSFASLRFTCSSRHGARNLVDVREGATCFWQLDDQGFLQEPSRIY